MSQHLSICRVIILPGPPSIKQLRRLLAEDVDPVHIDGSFALVAQDGERILLTRSLDRPMR